MLAGCRPGRYYVDNGGGAQDIYGNNVRCTQCELGNFCPGGAITNMPEPCSAFSPGLTTTIRAAKSRWACLERPGWGYVVNGGAPNATRCMGDTLNPGFAKQACQSCPAGFKINDPAKDTEVPAVNQHDSVADCSK